MLSQIIAELSSRESASTSRQQAILLATGALIDMRDPLTAGHSTRVARYAVMIARELGLIPSIQQAWREI